MNDVNKKSLMTVSVLVPFLMIMSGCDQQIAAENSVETDFPKVVLNDTGVTFFIDDSNSDGSPILYSSNGARFPGQQVIASSNGPNTFPGQDANFGKDTTSFDNTNGLASFSFTKLAKTDGNPLAADAVEYGCVKDNVTGLTWEHKTRGVLGVDIHTARAKFTWYDPNPATNGGDPGQQNFQICDSGLIVGNTFDFINEVNNEKLCGYTNWRLPTTEELRSIINYELDPANNNMVEAEYFPDVAQTAHRWTSQSYGIDPKLAFGFHMHEGFVQYHNKYCTPGETNYHNGIMLVRDEVTSAP